MAMDAILATIADGRQAIVDIDREAGRNELISGWIYYFILNPSTADPANPSAEVPRGGACSTIKNHAAGEANGSIMVGMFVCCVFCLPKAFQAGVFHSRQNGHAVNSLSAMDGRDRPLKN